MVWSLFPLRGSLASLSQLHWWKVQARIDPSSYLPTKGDEANKLRFAFSYLYWLMNFYEGFAFKSDRELPKLLKIIFNIFNQTDMSLLFLLPPTYTVSTTSYEGFFWICQWQMLSENFYQFWAIQNRLQTRIVTCWYINTAVLLLHGNFHWFSKWGLASLRHLNPLPPFYVRGISIILRKVSLNFIDISTKRNFSLSTYNSFLSSFHIIVDLAKVFSKVLIQTQSQH